MLLAALAIGAYLFYKKTSVRLSTKSLFQILGVGGVVAIHWITFFQAVKVSNVSVTLGCMASATLFTSFLEPLFQKRRISWIEVLIGLVIIVGLYIITQFAFEYKLGIIYALVSAFLASLFGVLNQQLIKKHDSVVISFYEMIAGFLLVGSFLLIKDGFVTPLNSMGSLEWASLLTLAFACTAFAFVSSVHLLKRLSAYTISLAINMEPVYGIIMAYFIFGDSERMDSGFYWGAFIIIAAIALYPILKKRYPVSPA